MNDHIAILSRSSSYNLALILSTPRTKLAYNSPNSQGLASAPLNVGAITTRI